MYIYEGHIYISYIYIYMYIYEGRPSATGVQGLVFYQTRGVVAVLIEWRSSSALPQRTFPIYTIHVGWGRDVAALQVKLFCAAERGRQEQVQQ